MVSRADQKRLDWVHEQPCICCEIEKLPAGMPRLRVEAHHLVDKGYRALSGGHQATLPLCSWHHRGVRLEGHSTSAMSSMYGPSLAVSKRQFVAWFGTERQLLARVNAGKDGAHVDSLEPG